MHSGQRACPYASSTPRRSTSSGCARCTPQSLGLAIRAFAIGAQRVAFLRGRAGITKHHRREVIEQRVALVRLSSGSARGHSQVQ